MSSSVHDVKTPIPELLNFDSWTSWNLFYELQICIPELFQEEYLIFIRSLFVIAPLNSWNPYSNTWCQLCGLYELIKIKFVLGQVASSFLPQWNRESWANLARIWLKYWLVFISYFIGEYDLGISFILLLVNGFDVYWFRFNDTLSHLLFYTGSFFTLW